MYIYIYVVTRSAAPPIPPNDLGSRPPPPLVCCGLWWVDWESPFHLMWVWWVGIPLPPSFAVVWAAGVDSTGKSWWGRIPSPSRVGSPGGREASLVRQTIFCGRRFCSETLGCPFRCFGRPWKLLLGTIPYKVIESVLMTARPPIIYYTLCYILYTIYSRVYIIYYRLYSVYMVYLYTTTIARPLKGGNQVLHTSLRATWELGHSILQHTVVQYIIL